MQVFKIINFIFFHLEAVNNTIIVDNVEQFHVTYYIPTLPTNISKLWQQKDRDRERVYYAANLEQKKYHMNE